MPYGRMADGSVMIGSLEPSPVLKCALPCSTPAIRPWRTGSTGEETAVQIRAEIQDEGYDLVIMNLRLPVIQSTTMPMMVL